MPYVSSSTPICSCQTGFGLFVIQGSYATQGPYTLWTWYIFKYCCFGLLVRLQQTSPDFKFKYLKTCRRTCVEVLGFSMLLAVVFMIAYI
jgi:hypothetical protein